MAKVLPVITQIPILGSNVTKFFFNLAKNVEKNCSKMPQYVFAWTCLGSKKDCEGKSNIKEKQLLKFKR